MGAGEFVLHITAHHRGQPEQGLKGRNRSRVHGGTRPTALLSMALSASSFVLPTGDTVRIGLDPPTSPINQENTPQACSQVNLMETFAQLKGPLPR